MWTYVAKIGHHIVRITVMVLTATPDHERNVAVEDGRQSAQIYGALDPVDNTIRRTDSNPRFLP